MKYNILFIAIFLIISSCQKNNNTTPDASKAVITILSPQEGHIYHKGDTVFVKATVTYPSEMHGYEVEITDSTGGVRFDTDVHAHADQFNINYSWVATGSQATSLKQDLTIEIDHNGTVANKSVQFLYRP